MDRPVIRARFKQYRQTIASLEKQLEDAYYYREEAEGRASRRLRAIESERLLQEQQDRADRWYREDQLRRATSDLERARSYGNDYEADRAVKKIRSLC